MLSFILTIVFIVEIWCAENKGRMALEFVVALAICVIGFFVFYRLLIQKVKKEKNIYSSDKNEIDEVITYKLNRYDIIEKNLIYYCVNTLREDNNEHDEDS